MSRGHHYARFLSGMGLGLCGDQLFLVAVSWGAMTDASAVTLGSVLMQAAVARALVTPVGGYASDRFSPMLVVRAAMVARAVMLGLLALGAGLGAPAPSEQWLSISAVVMGSLQGLNTSPMMAAVPRLVAREALARGNALLMIAVQVAGVVAPPAAGWLLTKTSVIGTWWWAVVCYAIACLPLQTRLGPSPAASHAPALNQRFGPYLARQPCLWVIVLMMACVYIGLMGPLQVGVPNLVKHALGNDPVLLGMLLGCFGLGLLGGTGLAASSWRPGRMSRQLLGALVVVALGLALTGLVGPRVHLLVCTLPMAGAGMGFLNVRGAAWLQGQTPAPLVGRAMGLVMFAANTATPLSLWGAGKLATEVHADLFLLGALVVAFALMIGAAVPAFRRA